MLRKQVAEPPLNAVMGPGSHYTGDLTFEGRVRIDGHFTGRIYTEDLLELGAEGILEGEIDVARAVLFGEVRGRIRVREHLLVHPTGRINGELDAGIVELRAGARIDGKVIIRGEELP